MSLYDTFRRVNVICLYALAAIGIVWVAGGFGLNSSDILSLTGLALAGVVYFQLIKLVRLVVKKKTKT
ncbi:hypothetical protein EXS54_01240 [Patescibacteria group bacterium]|nr:hypothetical protein [Patescibacteria group bacterium]